MARTPLLVMLALLLVPAAAGAQDGAAVTEFTGRTVVAVGFQAGPGVDVEGLRYLIEQTVGDPYRPADVARSVELLFRLGQFDDVQARVREIDGGVELTFVVVPSPQIRRIALRGVLRRPGPEVRAALSKGRGDPYVTGDEVRLATDVETYYRARGFLDVRVTPRVEPARTGRLVRLDVVEGEPYRVGRIKLLPPEVAGFSAERIERMLAPRLRVGKVYAEDDLTKATDKLLERYRAAGFVEARVLGRARAGRGRVGVEVTIDRETHTVVVSLPVEAGRLVRARFVGLPEGPGFRSSKPDLAQGLEGFRGARRLETVIGIEGAQRASEAYAEDAARQLARWLRRRGYYHATAKATVVEQEYIPPAGTAPVDQPAIETVRVLRFDVEQGPRVTLKKKDFSSEGQQFAKPQDLLGVLTDASPEVIGHRPLLWSVLGFRIYRRYYTEGAMEEAVSVLRDWYRARGFLDVQIAWDAEVAPSEDGTPGRRVTLALRVDEGIQTLVERDRGDGNGGLIVNLHVPIDDRTIRGWKARVEGRPFNPSAVEDLVREARNELAEQGFIDAEVTAEREFSDDRTLVRLSLVAVPGPAARFGQVIVRDNRFTHVGLIRREVADLPFELIKPGEVYKPSRVGVAQQRLLRTGLFDGVVLQPAQSSGRVRDVEIRVNERKRFTFVGATGITWPDDGPRVAGEVRARNLDGRGLSVFVRGRAALDWRFLLGVAPRIESRASLGVELPIPPGVPVRSTISAVANEELDEPTYRVRRSSVGVGISWRGSEVFGLDLRAEVQWRLPLRVDSVAQLDGKADVPAANPTLTDYKLMPLFGLTATVDRRDDRFNPREGIYATLAVDTTPGRVQETAPAFGRATGRVVGLVDLGAGFGLQLEGAGGLAWSYDDFLPPVEWRFRLGGTGKLRGFPLDQVGPWGTRKGTLEDVGLLVGELPERRVPVGGNAFYRYTVELLVPLWFSNSWRLALFHDGGNALIYGAVPAAINPSRLPGIAASVGFGLRRITPIGPLRLDFAFRPDSTAKIPHVALGEVLQVHFAVGAL